MQEYSTLTRNNDFRRVYARGRSYIAPCVVVYIFKDKKGLSKYGITASKKVGCAVKRNRARRVIKHAFFELLPQIKSGYSIVFVARAKTPFFKSQYVKNDLKKLFDSVGILKQEV